jgi:Arc/MetJ-type ribon-helix-helix transcriptional regulator
MSTRRITISLPEPLAERLRDEVGTGNVSAFVTRAIEDCLDDAALEAEWQRFYREVAPRKEDVRRADALFARLTRKKRGRAA